MVSLIDLLSNNYAPIQTTILPYLSVADVINLTLTCKGFGQLQPTLMATAYNINCLLGKFFDDPLKFRSLQGRYEDIVAGDVIQGWFHRSTAPSSHTLEIYVDMKHCCTFMKYFTSNGYKEVEESYFEQGDWLLYERTATSPERRILIHGDEDLLVGRLFHDSNFTSDLCFITWNKAYALFPYTTFIRRECYTFKDISEIDMRQAQCVEQGLSIKTVSWAHEYTKSVDDSDLLGILSLSHECEDIKELARRRRIGDEHTWLGIGGLDENNIMDPSLESSAF